MLLIMICAEDYLRRKCVADDNRECAQTGLIKVAVLGPTAK